MGKECKNEQLDSNQLNFSEEVRKFLLYWLQGFLILFLVFIFIVVLADNPPGTARRTAYSALVIFLLICMAAGMYFSRRGSYYAAAVITVACAAAGPWGSFLLDPQIFQGDFFPLVYVTIPVMLSSIFLSMTVTISLAAVQFSALILISLLSPASPQINIASFLTFVCILSLLSIIYTYLNNRAGEQIQQHMQQLKQLTDELQAKTAQLEQENHDHALTKQHLQESEEFKQAIISAAPLAIISLDTEGNVLTWNNAAEHIFGWSEEEALGKYPMFVSKNQYGEFNSFRSRVMQGEIISQVELHRRRKDGSPIEISLSAAPLTDKQGRCIGLLAIISDISQKKTFQKNLKRQKQIFQNLFDGSPDAIALLDQEDRVLEINKAFTRMFHYEQNEVTGKLINDLIAPPERQEEAWELTHLVAANQVVQKETVRCRKDGTLVQVEAIGYPNYLGDFQLGMFGIYRDLTEQKKLEHRLLQSQKMDSIGRLAGGVAHDFNNMLGVILGYTEMILEQLPADHEIYDEIGEISSAAQRSAALTNQLLAFARKQPIRPVILNLNQAVDDMLNMLRRLIGEDIDLKFFPSTASPMIYADLSQIEQMLINLCINAREAIPDTGGITIETKVVTIDEQYCAERAEFLPGVYSVLSVSDTGKGMIPEVQSNIFEPFFTTKPTGEGTGLGLSTVYGIIKQNKGFINVYSEAEMGTTFTIYFPKFEETKESSTEQHTDVLEIAGNGEKVLIVDDDPMMRNMAVSMLTRLNYSVSAAQGYEEALEIIKDQKDITLLITDVVMPHMNGKDLFEAAKQHIPGLLCLYMSGYTSNVIIHRGVLDKDTVFIQKPFSSHELGKTIKEVLTTA